MPARPLTLLIPALFTLALCACSHEPVFTQTSGGRLQGYIDDGVEHYLGIPYARPPVGDLRWRPPQPPALWEGTLEVQDSPSACAQSIPLKKSLAGSEDCLYLSVWTPVARPARPMPVMVWLHGGGFILGKGDIPFTDGRILAARGEVVVVTINYRLGVFGFMAHRALSAEDPAHPGSGNYGIEDQTAALRWVRDNIDAFGGDPGNVTIFGQSAGGTSVCAQLASPLAAGLFHRAINESGPCATPMPTLALASQLGDQVAAGVGCAENAEVLACMRDRSAQAVADVLAPADVLDFDTASMPWWPVQDGHVLPLQFMDAFESGRFNRVPVINGATRDEASLIIWVTHNLWLRPLRAEQYLDRLQMLLGSRELAETVARQYPLEDFASPFDALTAALSDAYFNCQARWQAQALSRHVPVWSYQFNYTDAPFFIPWADLKAYHSAELQYVFGIPMRFFGSQFSDRERELAASVMGYWLQFTHSGDPNGPGRVYWPAYDEEDRTLLFDLHNTVARGVRKSECQFWENLDYLRPVQQHDADDR